MKTLLTDEQILDYLDGSLDTEENIAIERLLNAPENATRVQELRSIHNALRSSSRLELPSRNFTQQVMAGLDSYKVARPSMRNGLLLFFGMVTAIAVAVMLLQAGLFDSVYGSIGLSSLPVKSDWLKQSVPSLNYSMRPILNILLFITIGLSFVILDRTILRPFFEQRSRSHKEPSLPVS